MKKRENPVNQPVRRPFFTTTNFIASVICLVLFLIVGLSTYYVTAGEFVSAHLAMIYAGLSLLGALAVLFRLYRFVLLYYVGCAIGWTTGVAVSSLKGAFAPTAGMICTGFFIVIFAVFGVLAQWKRMRKQMAKRKADREAAAALEAEDRKREELDRARLDRENAEALMHDAFGVEDGVDVTTPAAALDQAARLAFETEPPAQLKIPARRLEAADGNKETAAAPAGAAAAVQDKQ